MADWIFLDNHTTSRPSKEITEKMGQELLQHWHLGESKIAKASNEICSQLGVLESQFFLAGGSAAANFQVLFSHYMHFIRETGRTHILSLETEQSSILEGIARLEAFDVQGKILPVNEQGQLTGKAFEEMVRARSGMFSLSWAHPLTGVIQPIHDLVKVAKSHDIQIHLDISAAIGKLFLSDLGIDYLTIDGNLLHCPGEIGGILAKKNQKIFPLNYRTSHPPYAYYSALASSLNRAVEQLDHYAMDVAYLRDLLESKMEKLGAKIFFQEVERLPNTAVIAFEGIHSELLLFHLQRSGIFATTGKGRLSQMLKSCQIDPYIANSAVSFALSDETKEEEILTLCEMMGDLVEKLQKIGANS